jgi:multicomponent Na+:H+ antiporter subunit G
MSVWVWVFDVLITILLIVAVGFGAIAVIGLLLFPDIRSRSFTGLRAGILSTALVAVAGICYGIFAWLTMGGIQYLEYTLGAVLILVLVIVLNRVATDVLCHSSVPVQPPTPGEKDHP